MSAASAAKLYTPEILGLAVKLSEFPLTGDHPDTFPLSGEARSKTCGSEIHMGFRRNDTGHVEAIGLKVTACAIGQASAAIFAQSVVGKSAEDIEKALIAIDAWLMGGPIPDWPGIGTLKAAQAHPARHGAITLAWHAALNALCSTPNPR